MTDPVDAYMSRQRAAGRARMASLAGPHEPRCSGPCRRCGDPLPRDYGDPMAALDNVAALLDRLAVGDPPAVILAAIRTAVAPLPAMVEVEGATCPARVRLYSDDRPGSFPTSRFACDRPADHPGRHHDPARHLYW